MTGKKICRHLILDWKQALMVTKDLMDGRWWRQNWCCALSRVVGLTRRPGGWIATNGHGVHLRRSLYLEYSPGVDIPFGYFWNDSALIFALDIFLVLFCVCVYVCWTAVVFDTLSCEKSIFLSQSVGKSVLG